MGIFNVLYVDWNNDNKRYVKSFFSERSLKSKVSVSNHALAPTRVKKDGYDLVVVKLWKSQYKDLIERIKRAKDIPIAVIMETHTSRDEIYAGAGIYRRPLKESLEKIIEDYQIK